MALRVVKRNEKQRNKMERRVRLIFISAVLLIATIGCIAVMSAATNKNDVVYKGKFYVTDVNIDHQMSHRDGQTYTYSANLVSADKRVSMIVHLDAYQYKQIGIGTVFEGCINEKNVYQITFTGDDFIMKVLWYSIKEK